jgi:dTDP-glucose pyrophosphorylase
VAYPEKIAFRQQWIDKEHLEYLTQPLLKNGYGKYIM